MKFGIGVLVVVFMRLVCITNGCSPPFGYFYHPQNEFCDEKRIIIGQVVKSLSVGVYFRYTIRVLGVIKGYSYNLPGRHLIVYTDKGQFTCGTPLKKNFIYAMAVKKEGSRRVISQFMFKFEYSKMTQQQQIYMFTRFGKASYRANCKCKVSSVSSRYTCKASRSNTCYEKTGVCHYDSRLKRCIWFGLRCGIVTPPFRGDPGAQGKV